VELVLEGVRSDRQSPELDAGQQAWISGADCFFIASHHPQGGADASHRGGRPGFVTVLGSRRLSFPDYPGNNMFNTLGNIDVQPRVGLLFLDFDAGGILQLTGRASLGWNPETSGSEADHQRVVVSFEVDYVIESHGSGVTGRPVEDSLTSP
jgi:hypothetical protein